MTKTPGRVGGLILFFAAIASPAAAQHDPRFALVGSLPAPTVSFQWEVSPRFAVRVDGSYNYRLTTTEESSGDDEPTIIDSPSGLIIFGSGIRSESRSTQTIHSGSIGVSAIVALHRTDQLRLYVAPRVSIALSRQHSSLVTTVTVPAGSMFSYTPSYPDISVEWSSTSPGAGASFGVDLNVLKRLAVFGEAGFTYLRNETPLFALGLVMPTSSRQAIVNTRAAVGVMFRF
jgi:hypothetical protein